MRESYTENYEYRKENKSLPKDQEYYNFGTADRSPRGAETVEAHDSEIGEESPFRSRQSKYDHSKHDTFNTAENNVNTK